MILAAIIAASVLGYGVGMGVTWMLFLRRNPTANYNEREMYGVGAGLWPIGLPCLLAIMALEKQDNDDALEGESS